MIKESKLFMCMLIAAVFLTVFSAQIMGNETEATPGDNLSEVVNSRFAIARIDTTVDFSGYGKVMVRPLDFDNVKIVQPASSFRNRPFTLTEEDKQKINKVYQDEMLKSLQKKGSFPVVDKSGADVLVLSVSVLQIRPNAPKDNTSSRGFSNNVTVYSDGAGSMTIMAQLNDSVSGKILAAMADTKAKTNIWGVNNSVTNMGDVSLMFSSWGKELNKALKKITKKK